MKKHLTFVLNFIFALFVLFNLLSLSLTDEGVEEDESDESFLAQFLLKTKYKKDNSPPLKNNSFSITVSIKYFSIKMLAEQDKVTLDIDLIQQWNDPRLAIVDRNDQRNLTLHWHKSSKNTHLQRPLWLPKTNFLESSTLNDSISFERWSISTQTGDISLTTGLEVNATCQLDYNLFPVDQQNCSFSFWVTNKDQNLLGYKWAKKGSLTTQQQKIKLNGYYLNGFHRRTQPSYPMLLVDVLISRQFFFYFIRYYVPSFFVVVLSFTPLYMTPNAHSKVNLGVAVMLGMVMLLNGNYSQLPKVNYLTALDVYLFFCFFSVFLSVVEYALIGYFDLVLEKNLLDGDKESCSDKQVVEEAEDLLSRRKKRQKRHQRALKVAHIIDYIARKMYPSVFVLFHFVYAAVLITIVVQNGQVEIRHAPSLRVE